MYFFAVNCCKRITDWMSSLVLHYIFLDIFIRLTPLIKLHSLVKVVQTTFLMFSVDIMPVWFPTPPTPPHKDYHWPADGNAPTTYKNRIVHSKSKNASSLASFVKVKMQYIFKKKLLQRRSYNRCSGRLGSVWSDKKRPKKLLKIYPSGI